MFYYSEFLVGCSFFGDYVFIFQKLFYSLNCTFFIAVSACFKEMLSFEITLRI